MFQQVCERCRKLERKCDQDRPCAPCKEQNLPCHNADVPSTRIYEDEQTQRDKIAKVLTCIKQISGCLVNVERLAISRSVLARTGTLGPNNSDAMAIDDRILKKSTVAQQQTWETGGLTAAAHELMLRWPSIQAVVRAGKWNVNENYVLKGEDHGVLRLCNAGEHAQDEFIDIGAERPAGNSRGREPFASTSESDPRRSKSLTTGSAHIDTIDDLFNSYKKNIYRLHPFLDIEEIENYFEETFKTKECTQIKTNHSPSSVSNANAVQVSKWRRIDNSFFAIGQLPTDQTSNSLSSQPERTTERSLNNAMVYLMLALGEICETADPLSAGPLRGPVQEIAPFSQFNPPHTTTASPHLKFKSSCPRPVPNGVANPAATPTRRQSWDGIGTQSSDKVQTQTHEKIAGIVYYSKAASILGDFTDSEELAAAQARLLAALYKDQLTRVEESWSWVSTAARTCLYRMKL